MTYTTDFPEVIGYYWHKDTNPPLSRTFRNERIVKVIPYMGIGRIVFDPDMPLETISVEVYGGEWAGPIKSPEAKP